ncbi:MAG TPA: sulfatase [Verrucomicrobiota bacterium]|nr:sulfatase [Verrucomicrobiota bacterium]
MNRCDGAARGLRRGWIPGGPDARSRSGRAGRWRSCVRRLAFVLALFLVTPQGSPAAAEGGGSSAAPPNFVVLFADDLGYADLGCYGASRIRTPHLDRMAREGLRFTSFYVGQAVCSASRAALLTGCYPNRIGILGALGPRSKTGIHADETTLAEVLKARGYATAIYGKWHLGDAPEFLPTRHGFDEYYGLPYSNDMWPKHPQNPQAYPPLPLIEGERVIQTMPDQNLLTEEYTRRAVDFIHRHRDRPFFLYLPHSMPHVPLHAGAAARGRSAGGLYGDVIEELDRSTGRILDALRKERLDRKTLVMFLSDNGPWLSYGNHGGSAGGLREGKGTAFEGGIRVPCVMRWPGRIAGGRVCGELAATIDVLPTLAALAGAAVPGDRRIDGRDLGPLILGEAGARTPHEAYYCYYGRELHAIRSGPWKLHLPHAYPHVEAPGKDGQPGRMVSHRIGRSLYNLEEDVGERRDVAAEHPEVVSRLEALAEVAREDLGDAAVGRVGKNLRAPGQRAE